MVKNLDVIIGCPDQREALVQRLTARLSIEASGCHLWQGAKTPKGYGVIRFGPRANTYALYTHRVAAWIAYGSAPPGHVVMHSCDNPSCCNPDHLRYGTSADNSADMVTKRRNPRGSSVANAKLTEADIPAIRRDTRPLASVAADYGVDAKQIHRIKQGCAWRHC